ncbi:hypothetical protein [Mycobacterium sp. IS-1556]|uniref:hypothetical protein n=1 Tax=Mycobacterium sp. IS-1556 TaxID=1772276 RepID=UPI0007417FD9|nr:hypothetical protein [Mycobacterium sp. IS-1556]KUH86522.1 hypothetical protein AU187_05880 [Mycobacterium sp. IS-1556]
MTTASTARTVHPRDRTAREWRGSLGAMASRGEVDGPRVQEATAALAWWKHRGAMIETGIDPERAEELADLIAAETATDAEAVAR